MGDYTSLPNEVLNNIFQKLSKYDIVQCSFTCRAWNTVAQRILFKHLQNLYDLPLIEVVAILQNSKLKVSPGEFVKTIKFCHIGEKFDINLLDKLFPNLEFIDMPCYNLPLRDKIYQLIMEGKFLNLKKLPDKKLEEAHLKLLMARKDRIEEIELDGLPYNEHVMNEICNNIHLFTKLSKFKLNFWHTKATICVESMFSKTLPALKTIDISLSSPARIILKAPLDLNTIQTLPNVREIDIPNEFFRGGALAYIYFMKKFPDVDNFRTYSSNYESPIIPSEYKVPTVTCFCKFLFYLYNMKGKCHMGPMVSNKSTTKVVETFVSQALNQTVKTQEIRLHIAFDIASMTPDLNRLPFFTEYITASKIDRDNQKFFELKVVYRKHHKITNPLSYLELFERVGDMELEHLTVGHNSYNEHTPIELPVPLDIILIYFTLLKTLCIRGIWNITFSSLENSIDSTVECLKFDGCNLNQEIFRSISETCPNLKTLKVNASHFLIENPGHGMQPIPGTILIDMPTTNLRQLYFAVSLESTVFNDYKKAFVRLRTAHAKPRYCKLTRTSASDFDYDECSTTFETRKKPYTDDDFKKCVNDKRCRVYDIYCESVTELIIHADNKFFSEKYLEKKTK